MSELLSELSQEVKAMLERALSKMRISTTFPLEETFEKPPDPKLGDLASTISLRLARQLKLKPIELANKIREHIQVIGSGLVDRVEVEQPGYLNFFAKTASLVKRTIDQVMKQRNKYGWNNSGKGRKVLVEHTSINPTKPLHIGHLRNSVIGDIVSRIYTACGWNVEVENLIDDMGRQVAVLVWGFNNNTHLDVPRDSDMKLDLWYGLVYSKADSKLMEKPDLENEIEEIMRTMHDENHEISRFARMLSEKCLESNIETTSRLGIFYDLMVWESDIGQAHVWSEAFEKLKNTPEHFGIESEGKNKGCFVAKLGHLEEFKDLKSSDKVIVRSTGVPTYIASDIAYQMWKFGLLKTDMKYRIHHVQPDGKVLWATSPILGSEKRGKFAHADRVINVIGYEQKYLQQIVRLCLKLLGHEAQFNNSIHLSYKHVEIAGGRFSGRSGNWFGFHADAVVNRTTLQAYEQVSKNYPSLPELKKREISEMIGVGAVRYWLAKFNLDQTIIFDYDKVTDFNGETGPYIQYAAVRASSILEKAGQEKAINLANLELDVLSEESEVDLVKEIAALPEIVIRCAEDYLPNLLTSYAYALAVKFNKFYERRPVLNAPDKEKEARIALVIAARQTLLNALSLLGIQVPEEM
nr:arginine--tRNA ligase [Candidatus Njordarchaeum guaymaensis]